MRTLAQDTSPETEAFLVSLWRQHTPAKKLESLVGLRQLAKQLMLSGIRTQFAGASERELHHQWYIRCLGRRMAEEVFSTAKLTLTKEAAVLNEAQIIALVAKRLEDLRIPYFIGGSVASITHGEPRLTGDADFIVRILPFHLPQFVKMFETDFVVSSDAVQDSLNRRYAFNIIHLDTAFKIDFYPISEEDDLAIEAFARRQRQNIGAGEVWITSAEDTILAKLRWFKKGSEGSDQQWRDVLGVLKVQGERLDFSYLESRARKFGFADLLNRAREDAGSV